MIFLLWHRRSAIVKKTKRAKGQKRATWKECFGYYGWINIYKSHSGMVHKLHSQNKGKPNQLNRSSCHLKMVGKVIRLGAPLRPPTDNGDKNGMADDTSIVRQIKSASPSTSHHHNHRRGRMATPATIQAPNDKGTQPSVPNNNTTTKTTTKLQ